MEGSAILFTVVFALFSLFIWRLDFRAIREAYLAARAGKWSVPTAAALTATGVVIAVLVSK